MGQPVVHFEIIGKDGERLRSYYSELFGWEFGDVMGPTNYAVVQRDGNTNADGVGIGGGAMLRSIVLTSALGMSGRPGTVEG